MFASFLLSFSMVVPAAESLAIPHPEVPIGKTLTAYVGPRFLTNEPFVPEAAAVLVDETGRVRALLKQPPKPGEYKIVTLPGKLAVAGLHDAHIHVQHIGKAKDQVQLLGVTSTTEMKKRVEEYARKNTGAAAILGRGWDQTNFPGQQWPTWRDLEGATDKPVLLDRVDGHAALANKAMLALAGITKDTKDPAGGKIQRDDKGEPTGILIDNAIALAESKLPAPSEADIERWLTAGMYACAEAGLTSVTDQGMSPATARVLMKLDDAGKLPLRVFVYLDGSDDASYELLGTRKPTERLRFMGVKLFADGAMGSRGAALLDDYSDDKGNKGLLLTDPKALAKRIKQVHAKGFAAAVHAIGDRGNRVVLDAFKANPAPPGVRDRIEHAQLVHLDDIKRFAKLGVIASMQPTHATSDMRWAEQRVGKDRLKGAYAWRRMLDANVVLAFGSDAPVEDERPALGIYAALTRQDDKRQPPEGFTSDQRLNIEETLHAFAVGSAYAVGMERDLGALTPGMLFDVTLFSDDAATGDPIAWLKTKPVGTVVAGGMRTVSGAKR